MAKPGKTGLTREQIHQRHVQRMAELASKGGKHTMQHTNAPLESRKNAHYRPNFNKELKGKDLDWLPPGHTKLEGYKQGDGEMATDETGHYADGSVNTRASVPIRSAAESRRRALEMKKDFEDGGEYYGRVGPDEHAEFVKHAAASGDPELMKAAREWKNR